MSVHFIELPDRVFRVEMAPGTETPGHCRRTFSFTVESGPPLDFDSEEELDGFTARLVAELVGGGVDVIGWRVQTKEVEE